MSGSRLLFLSSLALLSSAAFAQELAADRKDGAAQVKVDDVKKWIFTLASPEFEGRGTGQEGFRKAAEYMRDQYIALGLEPAGDNGTFFQKVPWATTKVDADKTVLKFKKGGETVAIPFDHLGGSASKEFAAAGPAVLVTAADADAVKGLDLKDKVVVLLTSDDDMRARMQTIGAITAAGAKAVLTASRGPIDGKLQGRPGARGNRAARGAQMMPAMVQFGGADLTAVLKLAGVDLQKISGALTPLGLDAELNVAVAETDAPAFNVVARLPGRNPQKKDEYVVIGSHLDHLGKRGEQWFPGADDDGSGSTGVLAVATMFAKNKVKPERSILFLNFCGEESGLIGSRFFADHPTIPLASIVGELQMDMIGRDEEENAEGDKGEKAEDNVNSLHLIGSKKLAPALHELCMAKNTTAKFDLEWDQEGMFSRSDHANFARMGVPIAFFFTGLHRDYHRPTDTPDKINLPKLLRVATYVYDIAFELAQQEGRPQIDPELWAAYRGRGSETPAAPMAPAAAKKPGEAKGDGK